MGSQIPNARFIKTTIINIIKITKQNNIELTLNMNEMLMFLMLKTNCFNRGFSTDVTVQENNRNYHS